MAPKLKVGDKLPHGGIVIESETNVIRWGGHFVWLVTAVFPRG